jgi:hypothetical protein
LAAEASVTTPRLGRDRAVGAEGDDPSDPGRPAALEALAAPGQHHPPACPAAANVSCSIAPAAALLLVRNCARETGAPSRPPPASASSASGAEVVLGAGGQASGELREIGRLQARHLIGLLGGAENADGRDIRDADEGV